jgi:transcription antitermination protein NusB
VSGSTRERANTSRGLSGLMSRTDQRRAAVFICYQRDVTGAPLDELVRRDIPTAEKEALTEATAPEKASSFTRELVEGVDSMGDELDELIEEQAIDWRLDRIAPLERAILRIALFEILHRPDIPDEVAIDEAVETAKLYCGTQAPAFVNGILGGILRKVRS